MTEIFYQLFCHVNGQFYLFEKSERYQLVDQTVAVLLVKYNADKECLPVFSAVKEMLSNFEPASSDIVSANMSVKDRNLLAKQCLELKQSIDKLIEQKVKGIEYSSLSNTAYAALLHSDITDFFYLALYMNECRGKLLEHLLGRSQID